MPAMGSSRALLLALAVAVVAALGLYLAISTESEEVGAGVAEPIPAREQASATSLEPSDEPASSRPDSEEAPRGRTASGPETRTLVVSGTVEDRSTGIAVSDVKLRLVARSESEGTGVIAHARSDALGRYSLELVLPPGFRWDPSQWAVDVQAEADRIERIDESLGESEFHADPLDASRFLATKDLQVDVLLAIRGRLVRESDGRPFARGHAILYSAQPEEWFPGAVTPRGESDESGNFLIRFSSDFEPDDVVVYGFGDGMASPLRPIVLERGRVVDVGDLVLGEGACIEGTVRAKDGSRPLPTTVLASTLERRAGGPVVGIDQWVIVGDSLVKQDAYGPIGPDGRFRLCGLAEERYFLGVQYGGCSLPGGGEHVELVAPASGVELVLSRGVYRVRAVDAGTGTEVLGARFHFEERWRRVCGVGNGMVMAVDPGIEYSGRIVREGYRELACALPALVANEVRDLEFQLELAERPR